MERQTTCPECGGDNVFAHNEIGARGGYGPDLLPGLSGIFSIYGAKMRVVLCKDCGLMQFYASNEALAKVGTETGWVRLTENQ